MNRDNWFLVVPTVILGIVALVTVHRMYTRADVRKAVAVVRDYRAEGRPPLGRVLERELSGFRWSVQEVEGTYGTFDVSCVADADDGPAYRWRVDVAKQAFAPADEATRKRMRRYAPEIFTSPGGLSSAPPTDGPSSAAGGARGGSPESRRAPASGGDR